MHILFGWFLTNDDLTEIADSLTERDLPESDDEEGDVSVFNEAEMEFFDNSLFSVPKDLRKSIFRGRIDSGIIFGTDIFTLESGMVTASPQWEEFQDEGKNLMNVKKEIRNFNNNILVKGIIHKIKNILEIGEPKFFISNSNL